MQNYTKEINMYLLANKINFTCIGYSFLVSAIEIQMENGESTHFVRELYSIIGERYHTKEANVERAIRYVIRTSGLSNKEFILRATYSLKYGDIFNDSFSCRDLSTDVLQMKKYNKLNARSQ